MMGPGPNEDPTKNKEATIKTLAATIAAATLIAGAPAIAGAATPSASPIALTAVRVQAAGGFFNQFNPGQVNLTFTNDQSVAATDVIFTIESDGNYLGAYEDVGTFGQGVAVRHGFIDWATDPNQTVSVAEVTFADGSVWQSNTPVTPRALRQTSLSYDNEGENY